MYSIIIYNYYYNIIIICELNNFSKKGEKEEVSLVLECLGLVNVKEVLELEKSLFYNYLSGKNNQWMLNIAGNFDDRQSTCMLLKCLPRDSLLV